ILYAISSWAESSFYYLYGLNINPSTFFIVLRSNINETGEFLASNIDRPLMVFAIVMVLSLLLIIPYFIKQARFFSWFINPPKFQKRILIALIGVLVVTSTYRIADLLELNLPYRFITTAMEYSKQSTADQSITSRVGNFENSIRKRSENNETFVIVIGESLTRHHMSIYGYDRSTNPRLETIKDELLVFADVISPSTYTIPSLEKALTFSNYEDSTAVDKGSLIQLFNSVGFKTYWISNQQPLNESRNMVTEIAYAADETHFINMASNELSSSYDEMLIPKYEAALKDDYPKKVIFLHLLGNNYEYKKRYPEQFHVFSTQDDKYQEIEDIIDAYDNACVYNDYIVSEVLEKLKQKDNESFMLYFSSHGEEVYQTQDSYGHMEEDASKPMYDIPFILWVSNKFKENRPFRFRTYRKYMIDDLIHSVGHLANIKFEGYDASRSLFSIYFKNRTRIILKDVDYDKLFE
ncbi:MAG: sulfatase-like hydrolase/transferase, partial [Bacteroidia bacterium]|nr:sulfatase-like hydrolase/transferase [Bacteroidia bacterium]